MEKETQVTKNKKKQKFLKPTLISISAVFSFFILLELSFLFFAGPIFRKAVQKFVFQESGGVYSVNFSHLRIEPFTGYISIRNFELIPNADRYDELIKIDEIRTSLYGISLAELKVEGLSIRKLVFSNELELESLNLEAPSFRILKVPEQQPETRKLEIMKNDIYFLVNPYFRSVKIDKFDLEQGFFSLKTAESELISQTGADRISFNIKHFLVDSAEYRKRENLFYSQEIQLTVFNYSLRLSDDVHEVQVDKVVLSPNDSLVLIENAGLRPMRIFSEKEYDGALYEAEIPLLRLSGIDVMRAWNEQEVVLEHILLHKPSIKISEAQHRPVRSPDRPEIERRSGSLYAMMEGQLKSLSFDNFNIVDAQFSYYRGNERIPSYDVREFNLLLERFLLDSVSHQRTDRIFFSENISFGFKNVKVKIMNDSHFLEADSLQASAAKENLLAHGIRIYSRNNDFSENALINIQLDALEFDGMNFLRAFNYGDLYIKEFHAQSPKLNIRQRQYAENREVDTDLAYQLVSDFVHTLNADRVRISNASIDFKQYRARNRTAIYKGNFSLTLHHFLLNRETTGAANSLFRADRFDLLLSDFFMKPANDFHKMEMKSMTISSRDSVLSLKKFSYIPVKNERTVGLLQEYNKTAFTDAYIDELKITGIDIKRAVYGKHYSADNFVLNNFNFFAANYPQLKEKQEKEKQILVQRFIPEDTEFNPIDGIAEPVRTENNQLRDSLFLLLNEMFENNIDYLNINNLKVQNGYIYHANFDTLQELQSYTEGKISADVDSLHFRGVDSTLTKLPVSGVISMSVKGIKHFHAAKNLNLKAQEFSYSTADSSFALSHFRMLPAHTGSRDSSKAQIYLYIPAIDFRYLGTDAALNKQRFELGALDLEKVFFEIELPPQKDDAKEKKISPVRLPKFLEGIDIGSIDIQEGHLRIIPFGKTNIIGQTQFKLSVENIQEDPLNYSFPIKYEKALLTLNDFVYNLPDSISRIKVDSLFFPMHQHHLTAKNITFGQDSAISPEVFRQHNPGSNNMLNFIVSFLDIKGLNIQNLIFDRYINFSELTLNDVAVNIDKLKIPKSKPDISIEAFESRLEEMLQNNFARFRLGNVFLNNFSMAHIDHTKEITDTFALENIDAYLKNFNLNNPVPYALFFAEDIRVSLKDYEQILPDSLYRIGFSETGLSSKDSSFFVNDLYLTPLLGQYEFARVVGHQKARMNIEEGNIALKGLDFRALADNQTITADTLTIKDLQFTAFKDKHLPEDTLQRHPDILDMLLDFKYKVYVKEAVLDNLSILYEQNSEERDGMGQIYFEELSGTISNITNDSSRIQDNRFMRARLSTKLLDEANLRVSFRFTLDEPESYVFIGLVDTFDLKILNEFTKNTILLEVDNGISNKITFHVTVYDKHAEGKLHFFYNDLKISVLDTTATRRGFTSAIANVILPSDNPKNRFSRMRDGTIYATEVPYKHEIHLWVKAILSGALSSIALEPDEVKEFKKNKKRLERVLNKKKRREARTIRREQRQLQKEVQEVEDP